jgi:hypothetical protein
VTRQQNAAATEEVRLIGRLAADPEPHGRRMALRVVVTYGAERHERRVLATGKAVPTARGLQAGALIYVVGQSAEVDADYEIEAGHVLPLGLARARTTLS